LSGSVKKIDPSDNKYRPSRFACLPRNAFLATIRASGGKSLFELHGASRHRKDLAGIRPVNEKIRVIDQDGFRPNIGIILSNDERQLLWARRLSRSGWQFPQGGIDPDETPEQALYRELREEIGLEAEHVDIIGHTRGWLRYRLPPRFIRRHSQPLCIGQKQIYYLLRFTGEEYHFRLDTTSSPEFDRWRWVDYWAPVAEVIYFKRAVYDRALTELAPLLFPEGPPTRPPRRRTRTLRSYRHGRH
jgi:putative (di)nucleoside polyphosphate hydrolase